MEVTVRDVERLGVHLRSWIGRWPPPGPGMHVHAEPAREQPGWDGHVRPVLGVATPAAAVLGVAPPWAEALADRLGGRPLEALDREARAEAVADLFPDRVLGRGVFRWTDVAPSADAFPDAGRWVAPDDPLVPPWLEPFNGEQVLLALDDDGAYGGGVGLKVHDAHGAEVAVVVEEALRGRGLAKRLVAQAMRRVVEEGRVVVYLHARDNVASARVADALGLPDEGWTVWGLFPEDVPPPPPPSTRPT